MTQSLQLHAAPQTRDFVREEIRAVGLSLRSEALIVAIIPIAITLGAIFELATGAKIVEFEPNKAALPALIGFLVPFVIWTREKPFRPAFLWTLPVDRRQLALVKVFAGWTWLMGVVAGLLVWLSALTLFSGGTIVWKPNPLQLLVPFTWSTATYLVGSAVALGLRHPLRWLIAAVATEAALVSVSEALGPDDKAESMVLHTSRLLHAVLYGRYGIETLRNSSAANAISRAITDAAHVWLDIPYIVRWATSTVLWFAIGLTALWLAASRHRERRRN